MWHICSNIGLHVWILKATFVTDTTFKCMTLISGDVLHLFQLICRPAHIWETYSSHIAASIQTHEDVWIIWKYYTTPYICNMYHKGTRKWYIACAILNRNGLMCIRTILQYFKMNDYKNEYSTDSLYCFSTHLVS